MPRRTGLIEAIGAATGLLLLASPALAGTWSDDFEDGILDPPWTDIQGTNAEANGVFTASGVSGATHVGPVILTTIPGAAAKSHIRLGGTMTPTGWGAPGFSLRNNAFQRCGFYLWTNSQVWWTGNVSIEGVLGTASAAPVLNVPVYLEAELIDDALEIFMDGVSVFTGTIPNCSFDGDGTVGIEVHTGSSAVWDDFTITWYDEDADGDGYCGGDDCSDPLDLPGDCDDANANAFPGATESCNGFDDNCDGLVDDLDPLISGQSTWYADADGDGFGDAGASTTSCIQPAGTVTDATDCDDGAASNYPGNTELCDGLDNDCSGAPSFDAAGEVDADSDGFLSCLECDDADPWNQPGSVEFCDGQDNDCDGLVDDADPGIVGQVTWYADADADGVGDTNAATLACSLPAGSVALPGDCDDAASWNFPGNPEICDGLDNDCSGAPDADAGGEVDADSDGSLSCLDCDDNNAGNTPGAVELCDGLDNNCSGAPSLDLAGEVDADSDGALSCEDCDDSDAANVPGGTEICDGQDNDCDGLVDDADGGVTGQSTWYSDADGDGFGDSGATLLACAQPAGAVADATDCDDGDVDTYPGATELCDGLDNDCDGALPIDESDPDGDSSLACDDDCNDADATVYTGAAELCDGFDNDCDGLLPDVEVDADGDGVSPCEGDCDDTSALTLPDAEELCDGEDNDCDGAVPFDEDDADDDDWLICAGDCDDDDADINPDALEVCGNGADDDCDGDVDEEFDVDLDGFLSCDEDCDDEDPAVNPDADEQCNGIDDDCDGDVDEGFEDVDMDGATCEDCDDEDPTAYPGAEELCDGVDNDCDGAIPDIEADADGDGYRLCDDDCDDADAGQYPGFFETCDTAADLNCDGIQGTDYPACDEQTPECGCSTSEAGEPVDGSDAALALMVLLIGVLPARRRRR